MALLLSLACIGSRGSGFSMPERPDLGSGLGWELGVDPFTGQIWTSRYVPDAEVLADYQALAALEERSAIQDAALEAVFLDLIHTEREYVFRVDPADGYRSTVVGDFASLSAVEAHFGTSGAILGTLPLSADGWAHGSVRGYSLMGQGPRLHSEDLRMSPRGDWCLGERVGIAQLFPADLSWSRSIESLGPVQWSPMGSLMQLEEGTLSFIDPADLSVVRELPLLPDQPELEILGLLDLDALESQALLSVLQADGASAVYWLDLASGASEVLGPELAGARFTAMGEIYALNEGVLTIQGRDGVQRTQALSSNAFWMDDSGRLLVFEEVSEEGQNSFTYLHMESGVTNWFGRDLQSVEYIEETLWFRADNQVWSVDALTGLGGPGVSDCVASDIAALGDGTLAVRCDEDSSFWFGDEDGVADESLLIVDGSSGELIERVWL